MVFKSVGKTGKERYYIDGEEVTKRRYNREMEASHVKIEGGHLEDSLCGGIKPHPSDPLGYHPRQVDEAREYLKRAGVPTEILPDGRPIIRSRAHQKALIKLQGWVNHDGGYGD